MSGCWQLERGADGFPAALDDLGSESPPRLYGCGLRELVSESEPRLSVCIVGGRRATPYALDVARRLGADLARAGLLVVSGLAYGIDGAAHQGVLDVGGATVAVLAGGADSPSPRGQARLYRSILADGGAVISEHPPGTTPWASSFPRRNRIMAALCAMTIVVEAAPRSGSLITARRAAELGRDVGAVPGQVGMARSEGSNALLADGACVIRDATDALDAILGPDALVEPPAALVAPLPAGCDPVIEALEDGLGDLDAIALASGLDPVTVARCLAELEISGVVGITASGRYVLAARPAIVH